IASPLFPDPASGAIQSGTVGVSVKNSEVVIDKDYIIDAGNGILVVTSGAGAPTPKIENDGIFGNIWGVQIMDDGTTLSVAGPVDVINNDFAYNTMGLVLTNTTATPVQAYVASNIFWENHDQSLARNGMAIFSDTPGKVNLQNDLFSGNGASEAGQQFA